MAVFHPRARLDSYVEGALPPAARERIAAHLVECADCQQDVDQRRRILRAASSLSRTPAAAFAPSAPTAASGRPGAEPPVLETREGVPGWKLVMGFGAVGLLATGVLATAWIAGDPAASADGRDDSYLLPVTGPSSAREVPDAGPSSSGPVSPATSEAGSAGDAGRAPDAAGGQAVMSPAAPASPAAIPAGPGSGDDDPVRVTVAGAVDLTPAMVTELRQLGWNVPTLYGLGLRNQNTGWQHGEGAAEVVLTFRGDDSTLVLHECRALEDDAGTPACPVSWVTRDTEEPEGPPDPATRPRGEVQELPIGVDMSLWEHRDGSWTATTRTAQASYAVESDLPVETADRVMSMVVISERSRVQEGTAPDHPADRLARGFERILPWTEGPGLERR